MKNPVANEVVLNEDQARGAVCRHLARMIGAGCGQFRVRWFPKEESLRFEGERANRWETFDSAEYRGAEAHCIAAVLDDLKGKRNEVVEVTRRARSDQSIYVIRADRNSVQVHGRQLETYLLGVLFWD